MNAGEWLSRRASGVPTALAARLQHVVADQRDATGDISDNLAQTGARILRNVLASPPMTRAHALDVLAADALLTYAFEAAADDPTRLAQQADAAMKTIASIAEEGA